jgi:2-C-methyl-D-erythritol 4-phosphate cytidylyltransferase
MAARDQLIVAAIFVAAGAGTRLDAGVPKAFCTVHGRTLLDHALDQFRVHPAVRDIVIVAPATHLEHAQASADRGAPADVTVVAGGLTRPDSVKAGLSALRDDVEVVLVHDVARPFVPADVITRVLAGVTDGADAVVPAIAVSDTVKRVDAEDLVIETLDRSMLRAIQTPQAFRRATLLAAHAAAALDTTATDDAALVERLGVRVLVVEGADESFKITRPWDLLVAERIAR